MFPRRSALSLLMAVMMFASLVQAKSTKDRFDWQRVVNLRSGAYVRVQLRAGESVTGHVESTSNDSLNLIVGGGPGSDRLTSLRTITRQDVLQVYQTHPHHDLSRGTTLAIGAATGVAAGLLIGGIHDATHPGGDDPGVGKLVGVTIGGLLGAAAGGLIVKIPIHRDHLIYGVPDNIIK